jgi:hypothetical protein
MAGLTAQMQADPRGSFIYSKEYSWKKEKSKAGKKEGNKMNDSLSLMARRSDQIVRGGDGR